MTRRRIWPISPIVPALLLTPLLALASISLGYALVTPACTQHQAWLLHALTGIALLLSLGATTLAWVDLRRDEERRRFLALVSSGTGAFFSLVIAWQGVAQIYLSPCMH